MRLIHRLRGVAAQTLDSAWFFDFQQRLTIGPVDRLHRAIAAELRDLAPRSVLDVGCGTGTSSTTTDADFVGIDVNPTYIARANERFGGPRRKFLVADALTWPFEDKQFDAALYVNAMHHFDDAGALRILAALHRITRSALLIAEPAPETRMPVSRLLISLDQGDWIRPQADLRALIERAGFDVVRERVFFRGFAHTRLLVCRPRRPGDDTDSRGP